MTPAEKRAILGKATGDDGRGCPEPREEMPAGRPVTGDKSVECFQIQVEPRTNCLVRPEPFDRLRAFFYLHFPCHSETVTEVTVVGIRILQLSEGKRIATPV